MSGVTGSRRRLGRGLEALLGAGSVEEAEREGSLRDLPIETVEPNRFQPRRAMDPAALAELKQSIAASGLLQPVIVRQIEAGYELVAGERRWRAARELGWKKIPAVVRDVDDRTLLTLALVENLQRASLSAIEEAEGYDRLASDFKLSHAAIAEAVGRDRSTVANAVRLLKLPKSVQQLVASNALTAGHARALLSLSDGRRIEKLARECVTRGWSVREIERHTRGAPGGAREGRARVGRRAVPAEVARIESALRKRLGTDATVVLNGKGKGHLQVRFYSEEDLGRLLELILGRRWDG
ncbi:MAG TPA: ParB/RepB/Spo0J family partition protein [Gemmatimonadales bacterium]|nr:ParB/RepB/Spo0J family partition protein [Gemmatimonadales bacterium]